MGIIKTFEEFINEGINFKKIVHIDNTEFNQIMHNVINKKLNNGPVLILTNSDLSKQINKSATDRISKIIDLSDTKLEDFGFDKDGVDIFKNDESVIIFGLNKCPDEFINPVLIKILSSENNNIVVIVNTDETSNSFDEIFSSPAFKDRMGSVYVFD